MSDLTQLPAWIEPLLVHATNTDSVAVDGGAYQGVWSQAMSKKFRNVIAFELCPRAYWELVYNLNNDGLISSGKVTPLNIALGDDTKEVFFAGSMQSDSPIKRVYPAGRHETGYPSSPVQMMPLDAFRLPSLGFLKLDLQGYDYFALRGAEQTIRKFSPPIYVEIDRSCQDVFGVPEKAQQFLTELGYTEARKCGDEALWLKCTVS